MQQSLSLGLLVSCVLLQTTLAQELVIIDALPSAAASDGAIAATAAVVVEPQAAETASPPTAASATPVPSDASLSWMETHLDAPVPRVLAGTVEDADVNNLASPNMVAWLKQLLRENLPAFYEDTRKWDQHKEVWDGLDVSHEGLKIKTKRKRKLVNHGTWTRYRLEMVDPGKHLEIQFHKLEVAADGKVVFDVSIEMLLDVFGRLSQWVRDVQIISVSANADAVCKLSVQGTVEFQLNPLRFPPDIRIKPRVDAARVDVSYFRVRRISQLGGTFAEQLGNGLRTALEHKLEDSNEKLAAKMNKQLEKHHDRMLFSTQDWIQSKLPLPK